MHFTRGIGAILAPLFLAGFAAAQYEVGDVVSNFILDDGEGISHALYDYRGKIIVLNFGEHWCGPCKAEWAVMNEGLWEPNKDRGVVILTVGTDNEELFRETEDSYEGGWPWLFDEEAALLEDFAIIGFPNNIVIDQEFRLVSQEVGWSGNFDSIQRGIDAHLWNIQVHQIQPRHLSVRAGDTAFFRVDLSNSSFSTQTFTAWIDAILPHHGNFPGNPLSTRRLTVPSRRTVGGTVGLQVPGPTPANDYRVRVSVGPNTDTPLSSDVIRVTVE